MSLQFHEFSLFKVSATGNDFIVIDLRDPKDDQLWTSEFGHQSRSDWVITFCDRHEGLGADGAVFLEQDPQLDFAWDFYNSDGGNAEMCGNAARAVIGFVHEVAEQKDHYSFSTRAGQVDAKFNALNEIEVTLPTIKESALNLQIAGGGHYQFVRAGVPHAVVEVSDELDYAHLRAVALKIKQQPRFSEAGTNVTFWRRHSILHIESVTFERGVEDFTLSCGTGAVAAAFTALEGQEGQRIQVDVPGGRLFVIWIHGKPCLIGPAKIVAKLNWIRRK